MKRLSASVSVVVLSVAAVSGLAQDHIASLGITETRAKEAVFDSFMLGTLSLAGKAEVFKAAAPQLRAAMVTAVATMGRAFVESADFRQRYADHREANGPDPLPAEQTVEQIFKKQRADWEQQVAGIRAQFDQITPEQRKTLEAGFDEMRARFDQMEKENRPQLEASIKEQRAAVMRQHDEAMAEFEKVFPADRNRLVATRLQRFLDLSKDIDFGAHLVERNTKMRFVDPALEAKPAEWKLMFRAGKPAVDAARAFAQKWLADLQKKA